MVSALERASERSGFEPWPGTSCCVLVGQDTLLSRCLCPPRCIETGATETGISPGLMGHLARMQTLPFFYCLASSNQRGTNRVTVAPWHTKPCRGC